MDIPPNGKYAVPPAQYALGPAEQQEAHVDALLRTHSYLLNQAMDIQAEGYVASLCTQLGATATEHGNDQPNTNGIRYVHVIKNMYINLTQLEPKDINAFHKALAECQGLVGNETKEQQQCHTEGHNLFLAWYQRNVEAQNTVLNEALVGVQGQQGLNQVQTPAEPHYAAHGPRLGPAAGPVLEDLAAIQARFFASESQFIQMGRAETMRQNQAEVEPEVQVPPSPKPAQQDPAVDPVALHLWLAGAKYIDPNSEDAARAEVERIAVKVRSKAVAEQAAFPEVGGFPRTEVERAVATEVDPPINRLHVIALEEADCLKEAIKILSRTHCQYGADLQYPGKTLNLEAYIEARSRAEPTPQALQNAGCRDDTERRTVLNEAANVMFKRYCDEEAKKNANVRAAVEPVAAADSLMRELARQDFERRTDERANVFANDPVGQKRRVEEVIEENNRMLQRAIEIQAEGQSGPFRWPGKSSDDVRRAPAANGVVPSMEYKQIVKQMWDNFTELSKVARREGLRVTDPGMTQGSEKKQ
jgi:hypothetical protein